MTVNRFESRLTSNYVVYSRLQGPGMPVFTFSYMHVRVCVYITAFARVQLRVLCLL